MEPSRVGLVPLEEGSRELPRPCCPIEETAIPKPGSSLTRTPTLPAPGSWTCSLQSWGDRCHPGYGTLSWQPKRPET